MVSGFTKSDPIYGTVDLDDEYLQEQELLNRSTSGNLYAWGYNDIYNGYFPGYAGIVGTTTTPIQVGSGNSWTKISRGAQGGSAIKSDGTLWTWGRNDVGGTLGDGTTTSRSTPIQIGTDTNWKEIACGYFHNLAIRTDGTLWAWGFNDYGQLGLGDTSNRSSPTQVGSLTDWKYVFPDNRSNFAMKTDGTIWAWGRNASGCFATGDTIDRSSPVQVTADNNWKYVAYTTSYFKGLRNDGTLWVLGDGNAAGISSFFGTTSPVQLGTDNTWKKPYSSTTLVKKEGSIWTTEYSYFGFGAPGTKRIDGSLGWKKAVGQFYNGTAGIKTDGTLWAWGGIYSSSTPIQIGTANNWIDIAANGNVFMALASG